MTFPYKVEPDENMHVFYAYFPDGHVETKGCDEAFQEPWTVKALPEGDELVEVSKKRLEALNTLWREIQKKNRAHDRAEQFADYTGDKSPEENEEFNKAIADMDEASRRVQEATKALEAMDREWEEEAEKGDDGRRTPSDPTPGKQGNRGTMEDI